MKDDNEELKGFMKAVSDGDAGVEAANAKVAALFAAAAAQAPEGAQARVLARVKAGPSPYRRPAAFLAAGLAFAALVLVLRPAAAPAPLLAPDWRSYDNFPYYTDEARMYLEPLPLEGQAVDGLIPSAEYGRAL